MGAIRKDGSNEGDDGNGEATDEIVLSPRELAMQEISDQLAAQQDESAAMVEAPVNSTVSGLLADDQLDKVLVRVKVDGQEKEMPLSAVTKGYQKDAVASQRLAQAAQERKELEQRKLDLDERERQLTAGGASLSAEDADVDAQVAAAMAGLVEGDVEAASAALKSILAGRGTAPPVIDEAAIIAKAKSSLREEEAALAQEAVMADFFTANPVFADETSKERQYGDYLFVTKYGPLMESGQISYREALDQAAGEVMEVFKGKEVNPRQQKIDRKATIDNLPVAGARSTRQAPAQETTDDILAEMRRERGQPV
jgi:hypothetical protein